jgi:hypothetical protein
VQQQLERSSISLTLGTYSHVSDGLLVDAADELEDLLGRAV